MLSGDTIIGVADDSSCCGSCGMRLALTAKFCSECGRPVAEGAPAAEYKQVTVLFADVVHSMDIAASVGAERLREIMAGLADRCAAVVQRFEGTVDKFTGDGIMAVFGAPRALEDHAVRACLAALAIQEEAERLAIDVLDRDGVELRLRVGLNSGQVIAGEIGSGALGYTAIGEQVGLAQRMESIAPPGGVMLSQSTVRLVEGAAVLDEQQLVHIKGRRDPIPACRLRGISLSHGRIHRQETTLVGRQHEVAVLATMLDRAIDSPGGGVKIVGMAGIGKSRLVRETAAMAGRCGVSVVSTFGESHARGLAFRAVAALLRALFNISGLGAAAARERTRSLLPRAGEEDLRLLDDLLGIGAADAVPLDINADARRRRLTRLVDSAVLTRTVPTLYIIEDAHWLDEVSESMLESLFPVLAQTSSLVLLTYRPEYHGVLAGTPDCLQLTLAPLGVSDISKVTTEMLGCDPSVVALSAQVAERSAGNPFFAEEIVRDLAERHVLCGRRGAYVCPGECGEVSVPATVHATIAARIDRLGKAAKHTLNAAAVIGSRFDADLLAYLDEQPALADLVDAELLEPVATAPRAQYVFRHPLIRAVAYESQLRSGRWLLHQRVAAAIQQRDPSAVEENAALIATHHEAAGDLRAALGWYMRAATWLTNRDIVAAQGMWLRARDVADRLPNADTDRTSMRIAPRTLLCGYAWCVGGAAVAETGLDELRELCDAAGDPVSLAMGMSGVLVAMTLNHRLKELQVLGVDYIRLLESIGDRALIVGLLNTVTHGKFDAGESIETLRLVQRVIDLADGDAALGSFFFESPLAWAITLRGLARSSLGLPGWRDDLRVALAMARRAGGMTQAAVTTCGFGSTVLNGVLVPDATALEHTAEALATAERSGNDVSLAWARVSHGTVLVGMHGRDQAMGMELLAKGRQQASRHGDLLAMTMADIQIAECRTRAGDTDAAIETAAATVKHLSDCGNVCFAGPATRVLVEALIHRGSRQDLQDAQTAVDRLAACPTDAGFVFHVLPLLRLRALLAQVRRDTVGYRDYCDRYCAMATSLGFEGHIAMAQAMC